MKKKKIIRVLFIGVIVICTGIIFSCSIKSKKTKTLLDEKNTEDTNKETESIDDENLLKLCIHVCGSVNNPGVYYLDNGMRIHDAILAAGGFSKEANQQYLNLAKPLTDGEQIYIPSNSEVASNEFANSSALNDGLVNINNASMEELKTLPGIGDVKANAIISYREDVGKFSSIDDIKNVAGIKDSSYEKIKDYIKV